MIVKLLTELHLECLSLKGGCRGSSESTGVKMPHCWKSHALAHCSWIAVVLVHVITFLSKIHLVCHNIANGIKPGSD